MDVVVNSQASRGRDGRCDCDYRFVSLPAPSKMLRIRDLSYNHHVVSEDRYVIALLKQSMLLNYYFEY